MKNLKITNIILKEKECALSLLRIPINFFAEEPQKPKIEDKNGNIKNSDTPASSKENSEKINVELNDNGTAHIHISKQLDLDMPSEKNTTTPSPQQTPPPSETSQKEPADNSTSSESQPSSKTSDQSPPPQSTQSENSSPDNTTSPPTANQENSNQSVNHSTSPETEKNESQPSDSSQPSSDNKTAENSSDKSKTPQSPALGTPSTSPESKEVENSPSSDSKSGDKKDDKTSPDSKPGDKKDDKTSPDSKSGDKKDDKTSPDSKSGDKKDDKLSPDSKSGDKKGGKSSDADSANKKSDNEKESNRLRDKFDKKNPVNSAKNNVKGKIDNAKNNLRNNIAKNPLGQKALNGLDKVSDAKKTLDNAKDAINNLDADKMKEAAGDIAVKAAALAGNAVAPGLGKGIEAADKLLGKTKVGKSAKKALGGCCALGCIGSIIMLLLPIITLLSAFSWITNLFSITKDFTGYNNEETLTSEELGILEEAATIYSMQDYTDLTTSLNNLGWWAALWGQKPDYPIQASLEKYLDEYSYYTEENINPYRNNPDSSKNNERKAGIYEDLVERGYLLKNEPGDHTSFGMAFNLLADNYDVYNLKAPTSAPKREKEINGQKVIYTTYDPTGTHQALFEDVLTDISTLKGRFNGQVDPTWFDELNNILDEKFDVYIDEFDETRNLSLRDLFIETSSVAYDTEYHVNLVYNVFSGQTDINSEIITQYNELVKRLSMLELMTYMLDYQQYYQQIEKIKSDAARARYKNSQIFENPDFWGQFLTFSNVEHYLALSSVSDHSLAYDIAKTSYEKSLNVTGKSQLKNNPDFFGFSQLENWYATYYFNPSATVTPDGNYTYNINCIDVKPTNDQKTLFDKYNVYSGIFDKATTLSPEEKAKKNENAFFAIFETATGIEMGEIDDDGNLQSVSYILDTSGLVLTNKNRVFPLNTRATITMDFGEQYSAETVAEYNLSHTDHRGIDYSVPVGTEVYAITSGTAYWYRGNDGWGNYVQIVHDDGHVSYYAHGNGTFYINNGQRVTAGQPIMESGNSGNSTGPHLHWEIRNESGTPINPTSYVYGN